MTVRYTARARADLQDIFDYIAIDSPDAARRVRQAIFDAIQLVAARPYASIRNARAPDMRSKLVTRYPYRVHYRINDGDVWIVHIRHTARHPWVGEGRS
jgi:plasmid stabilization system protein ParE